LNYQLTTIILAGGKSSRMGFPKGLAELKSVKMIEHVVNLSKKISNDIMIIANDDSYNYLGLPVYNDDIKDCGPIGGIYTGLKHSNTDCNFVVACDMPFVSEKLVNELIQSFDGYDVVVPSVENTIQPLCALYHKRIVPIIKQAIDKYEYSVYKTLNLLSTKEIVYPENMPSFININTISDLNNNSK
jgi:molybdopterin-guanine dinucleotide biosynthesis protein A